MRPKWSQKSIKERKRAGWLVGWLVCGLVGGLGVGWWWFGGVLGGGVCPTKGLVAPGGTTGGGTSYLTTDLTA